MAKEQQSQTNVVFTLDKFVNIDASSWDALITESHYRNVFYAHAVIESYIEHAQDSRELQVVVGYRGGKLVFLQPCYFRSNLIGKRMELLEVPTSDTNEPIVSLHRRNRILEAYVEFLAKNLKVDLLTASSITRHQAQFLSQYGTAVEQVKEDTGSILEVPQSMDNFWKQLKGSFRSDLRRKVKRAAQQGLNARIVFEEPTSALRKAFSELNRVHEARFETLNKSSFFLGPMFQQFHRSIIEHNSTSPVKVSFTELLDGNKVIGSLYGIRTAERFVFLMSGFDPDYERFSPGMLLLYHTVEHLVEQGTTEFDFKCGDQHYKRRWANVEYTKSDLSLALTTRGRGMAKLSEQLARIERTIKAVSAALHEPVRRPVSTSLS